MNKQTKRGFTIVELVVVIAIIAILAAVLIPTFSNLIKRANISRDTQLIRNLNMALVADSAKNGTHTTMQSALDAAELFGYDVAKINASATDNEILWDGKNDVFCYFNADSGETNKIEYIPEFPGTEGADPVDYFIISKDIDDNYSTYYTGTAATITTDKGFDAGKSSVASITYDRSSATEGQTVVIRTNGGILTVNAPADTVKHYGEAAVLNIEAVASTSYHEFGTVANAQLKKGRVVIENSDASIGKILLIAKSEAEGFEVIKIEAKNGATLPELDRTKVTIGTNGTKVCDITVEAETNSVWLYAIGIFEQIKISDADATSVSSETEGAPDQTTPLGKAAYEIANAAMRDENGLLVDENGNSVTVENAVVIEKDTPTQSQITNGITLFSGGLGTESNPYLISMGSQFKNITGDLTDKCFKIINDIEVAESDFTDASLIATFSGTLDGGNNRVKFPYYATDDDRYLINSFGGTLQNIEIEFDNFGVIVNSASTNVSFTNVDVYGMINCNNNYGAYILVDNAPKISFTDCDFYGTISAGGSKDNNNAIYVGQTNTANFEERALSFDNCHNYGSIMSGDAVMFIANVVKYNQDSGIDAYVTIDINHCTNEGLVQWIENTGYRPYNHFASTSIHMVKEITINGVKYVKTVNLTADQIAALNIDGINVIAMDQENTSDGKKLVKHTSPVMPDANGRNYVVSIADATLNIYLLEDNSFRVYEATSNVAYYEVTNKTMVHYNGASQLYIITERIESNQFVDGKFTTTMKNYTFLDDTYISKNASYQGGEFGTITISGVEYPTYAVNGETHYYYHDDNFYFAGDMYKNKAGSVYVTAYDSNGKVVASAKLSDDPEPVVVLPDWYVAYDPSTMVNLVETGVSFDYNTNYNTMLSKQYYSDDSPYLKSGNTNDYATGFMPITDITDDTCIFIKTKSIFNTTHDRIFFGYKGTNNIINDGRKTVQFKNASSYIKEYVDGEYHIYMINLNEFYLNNRNGGPSTLVGLSNLYIGISVSGAGCGDTIVYRVDQ